MFVIRIHYLLFFCKTSYKLILLLVIRHFLLYPIFQIKDVGIYRILVLLFTTSSRSPTNRALQLPVRTIITNKRATTISMTTTFLGFSISGAYGRVRYCKWSHFLQQIINYIGAIVSDFF